MKVLIKKRGKVKVRQAKHPRDPLDCCDAEYYRVAGCEQVEENLKLEARIAELEGALKQQEGRWLEEHRIADNAEAMVVRLDVRIEELEEALAGLLVGGNYYVAAKHAYARQVLEKKT